MGSGVTMLHIYNHNNNIFEEGSEANGIGAHGNILCAVRRSDVLGDSMVD